MEEDLDFILDLKDYNHPIKGFRVKNSKYKYEVASKDYIRNTYLLSVYGITLDIYNNLLRDQNHACAICKKSQTFFIKNLSVDHCHNTGNIRGLLCANCNHGLGKFEDNIEFLNDAIKYLQSK